MAVGDYDEILKYYELHETIGTGRYNLWKQTGMYNLSNIIVFLRV